MESSGFEGRRGTRMAVCLVLAVAPLCGCAGTFSSIKGSVFGGAPQKVEETQGTAPSVYYVGADELPLYREPGKTVVARLRLHQKVYRYRLESGYAYVKVEGSDQEGWLDNGKLIWRLPGGTAPAAREGSAETAAPPAETTAPPAAADSSPPAAPAAPPSAGTPPEGTPPVSPSVFEPY
jgi:hypothetical protein